MKISIDTIGEKDGIKICDICKEDNNGNTLDVEVKIVVNGVVKCNATEKEMINKLDRYSYNIAIEIAKSKGLCIEW